MMLGSVHNGDDKNVFQENPLLQLHDCLNKVSVNKMIVGIKIKKKTF